jgi:hypothetical protein
VRQEAVVTEIGVLGETADDHAEVDDRGDLVRFSDRHEEGTVGPPPAAREVSAILLTGRRGTHPREMQAATRAHESEELGLSARRRALEKDPTCGHARAFVHGSRG